MDTYKNYSYHSNNYISYFFQLLLLSDDPSKRPADEVLSPREIEVLRLVALGYTNKVIAARLFLSVKTVESYRARIMGKLGLKSRAALVRYALRKGLLDDAVRELSDETSEEE